MGAHAGKIRKTGALTGLTGPNGINIINNHFLFFTMKLILSLLLLAFLYRSILFRFFLLLINNDLVVEPNNRVYRAKFYNVQRRVYYREYYPWDLNLSQTDDAGYY